MCNSFFNMTFLVIKINTCCFNSTLMQGLANILFASHSPDECNAVCMCDSMHPEEVVVKDFVYALTNLVAFI